MPHSDDSLERLERQLARIDDELTPEDRESRKKLLESILGNLIGEGIVLSDSRREYYDKYISGEITMRELSKYLLGDD